MTSKNRILTMIKNMGVYVPPLYTTDHMTVNKHVKLYVGKNNHIDTQKYIDGLLFRHLYVSDNVIGPYLHYANTHVINLSLSNRECNNIFIGYAIVNKIKSLEFTVKSIDKKQINYYVHKINELMRKMNDLKISHVSKKLSLNTLGVENNEIILLEPKYVIFDDENFEDNICTFDHMKKSLKFL